MGSVRRLKRAGWRWWDGYVVIVNVIAGLLGLAAIVYLVIALIRPEKL